MCHAVSRRRGTGEGTGVARVASSTSTSCCGGRFDGFEGQVVRTPSNLRPTPAAPVIEPGSRRVTVKQRSQFVWWEEAVIALAVWLATLLALLHVAHRRRCPRESGSRLLQVVLVPRDRKGLTAARAQLLRNLGDGQRDAIAASWTDEVASPECFRRAAGRHLWVPQHSPLPRRRGADLDIGPRQRHALPLDAHHYFEPCQRRDDAIPGTPPQRRVHGGRQSSPLYRPQPLTSPVALGSCPAAPLPVRAFLRQRGSRTRQARPTYPLHMSAARRCRGIDRYAKFQPHDQATVAELVDAQDLGSCGATRGGSSPSGRIV